MTNKMIKHLWFTIRGLYRTFVFAIAPVSILFYLYDKYYDVMFTITLIVFALLLAWSIGRIK